MSYHSPQGSMIPRQIPAAIDAATLATRGLLAILGAALLLAAFGLWLVPGASYAPDLMLAKLGLSLFMLLSGASCLTGAKGTRD